MDDNTQAIRNLAVHMVVQARHDPKKRSMLVKRSRQLGRPIASAAAAIALAVLASGCTQTPKLRSAPPAPVIAKVAIPVPCEVAKIPKPDRPKRLAELTDPIWTATRLIVADHMVLEAYAKELEVALVDPCGTPKP